MSVCRTWNDNIGFTLFEDMGNVFARPQEMLPAWGGFTSPTGKFVFRPAVRATLAVQLQLRFHAVGIGVRYQTPIGPLRFDSDTI